VSADIRAGVLVVGGGPGGYVAALRAATLGADVVLVEADQIGGVCLNEGCIPSKILLHAVESLASVTSAPWVVGGESLELDHGGLQAFKDATTSTLRTGVGQLLSARGVRVLSGVARFTDDHVVQVADGDGEKRVEFDSAVVATGSRPVELSHLPFDGTRVVHAAHVLSWGHTPRSVVLLGGGAIGVELATYLSGAGCAVTLVEAQAGLLAGFDPQVSRHVVDGLQARGVDIRTGATALGDDGECVTVRDAAGNEERVRADHVVVAVGRVPTLPDFGPLTPGTGDRGHLRVDRSLRTSISHVLAIGDVTEGPALAHRASAQGKVAGANVAGGDDVFEPWCIPSVVYGTPELARVGLRVEEAEALGHAVDTRRFSLRANGRALGLAAQGEGLCLFDPDSGRVLGYELAGPGAGEVVAGLGIAIELGAVVQDLADIVLPHPSIAEVTGELADLALGLGVHGR